MVVIDPQTRTSANNLLKSFFDLVEGMENLLKNLVMLYLKERQTFGEVYLLLILGHVDFYRMDGKIREEGQSNKRKICLKVKKTIVDIIIFLNFRFQRIIDCNAYLKDIITQLVYKWR